MADGLIGVNADNYALMKAQMAAYELSLKPTNQQSKSTNESQQPKDSGPFPSDRPSVAGKSPRKQPLHPTVGGKGPYRGPTLQREDSGSTRTATGKASSPKTLSKNISDKQKPRQPPTPVAGKRSPANRPSTPSNPTKRPRHKEPENELSEESGDEDEDEEGDGSDGEFEGALEEGDDEDTGSKIEDKGMQTFFFR